MKNAWVRKLSCLLVAATSFGAATDSGLGEVLIVLSGTAQPYQDAEAALRDRLKSQGERLTTVQLAKISADPKALASDPRAVVAIGTEAAAWVHKNSEPPTLMVYTMVSDPQGLGLEQGNRAFGVSVEVPASEQLAIVTEALPKARKVAMLVREGGASERVAADLRHALPSGWYLEVVEIRSSESASQAIERMLGLKPDIVWTAPDASVYDAATVRALLLAALRQNVPVFGFSPQFVRAGALLGTGIDPAEQGRHAGEIVLERLRPDAPARAAEAAAPRFQIAVNPVVAERLGISLPRSLLQRAEVVHGK